MRAKNFDAVFRSELACLKVKRLAMPATLPRLPKINRKTKPSVALGLTGLVLSGGGVRSATFCYGVLQALAESRMLGQFDYISSVSGGGYIGCYISSLFLDQTKQPEHRITQELGVKEGADQRHLRDKANYLRSSGLIDRLMFTTQVIFGFILNFLIIFPGLIAMAIVLQALTLVFPDPAELGFDVFWYIGGILVLFALVYGFGLTANKPVGDNVAVQIAHVEAWALMGGLCAVIFVGLQRPMMHFLFNHKGLPFIEFDHFYATLLSTFSLIGVIGGLTRKLPEALSRIISRSWRFAVAILTPFALWLVTLIVQETISSPCWLEEWPSLWIVNWIDAPVSKYVVPFLSLGGSRCWDTSDSSPLVASYGVTVVLLYTIVTVCLSCLMLRVNVNRTSLHSRYRDRLRAAYIDTNLRDGKELRLSSLALHGPYHIINTSMNIQGSKENRRGRNADSFILSRNFCGGELTGYVRTNQLEDLDPNFDLSTAVAISGAAVSPNQGQRTNRFLRLLMGLANIRLGYWFVNPGKLTPISPRRHTVSPYYFFLELAGRLDENRRNVYLTDGGHFENLGLYELLRRKCKFILLCDAEQDVRSTFNGLAHVIRLARIDFGYDINISVKNLQPQRSGFSEAHIAVGEIKYSRDETGTIIYLKSTITGDESLYVHEYRSRAPDFPHETTADQFFTEEQYEAYRALGYHIGQNLAQRPRRWTTILQMFDEAERILGRVAAPPVPAARVEPVPVDAN